MNLPLEIIALKVKQPVAEFFLFKIKAKDLLEISFSEPLKYVNDNGEIKVSGSQRKKDTDRLKQIAKYIDSAEMAFPNSIILAANYSPTGKVVKDENIRWTVEYNKDCDVYKIKVPTNKPLAAIIDGQHRLNAFEFVKDASRQDVELICSAYFDIPNSYQAFLFATINSNQKKVDRSLALEQFGFNVDDEPEKAWTPEKLAVFMSRKLNADEGSPFFKHIKVAPINLDSAIDEGDGLWTVSTATVVDGILSLISSNAKRDRIIMQQKPLLGGRHRSLLSNTRDISPLRELYISKQDLDIYNIVMAFFSSVNKYLWSVYDSKSYITKTVGILALFNVLKQLLKSGNVNTQNYDDVVKTFSNIDFSDTFFQASGIGKTRIKNAILLKLGLIDLTKIKEEDHAHYNRIITNEANDNAKEDVSDERELWEIEVEKALLYILERVEWNYKSKSVTIYGEDEVYEVLEFKTYQEFKTHLELIVAQEQYANLPGDEEMRELMLKGNDPEDIVENYLFDYKSNLEELGWW